MKKNLRISKGKICIFTAAVILGLSVGYYLGEKMLSPKKDLVNPPRIEEPLNLNLKEYKLPIEDINDPKSKIEECNPSDFMEKGAYAKTYSRKRISTF